LAADGALLLRVKVAPGAKRPGLTGVELGADGVSRLKLRIAQPPEDGAANRGLVALVADGLSVPKTAITLESGLTDRRKTLRINGDPAALDAALQRWTGITPDGRAAD
jgi:hypothetical protein